MLAALSKSKSIVMKISPLALACLVSLGIGLAATARAQENSSITCKEEQNRQAVLLADLESPICNLRKKELVKARKESKLGYTLDFDKLGCGSIQIFTEMNNADEFKDHPLKGLDYSQFSKEGSILISRVAYMIPNKDDEFYSLAFQTDKGNLESRMYRTTVKKNDEAANGKIVISKTLKASIPTMGEVIQDVDMEVHVSIYDPATKTWQGPLASKGKEAAQILQTLNDQGTATLKTKQGQDLGTPKKTMVMEMKKASNTINGSVVVSDFYDLGKNDPRTLVITNQVISLSPYFPQSESIGNAVMNILNSTSFLKRPLKNMIQGKIIDRTNYETGLSIDAVRVKGHEDKEETESFEQDLED